MGFSTWVCCGCKKTVINIYAVEKLGEKYRPLASVVCLLDPESRRDEHENKDSIYGQYDGYGRLITQHGSISMQCIYPKSPRWYHRQCYFGQSYEETEPSPDFGVGQGYFISKAEADEMLAALPKHPASESELL